ncbi:MAG: Coenzyme F420 hydrogenase/dehydrogenase, beta subunit C-terminal domain [Ruminococcus sp.]|nr:Coenzyme F420 hydrogenase/dehydrogenase, beta subunit C-terminal domain [Ruminococcus sp.]
MSKYIANISDCCGCSVCLSVCQCMAITMKPNDLGFLYPCIDEDLCIECGDCKDVCPVLETNLNKMVNLFDKKAYTGYLVDNIELLTSTSGGFANAISKKIIEQGGCVFGVKYGDNFIPEYDVAYTEEELEVFKGSKYTEVNNNKLFECVKSELNVGKKVLVIGLPCVIASLKKYINTNVNINNLYLCELICGGYTSRRVLSELIEEMENKYESKVSSFIFRVKNPYVLPCYFQVGFENGIIESMKWNETYFEKAYRLIKRDSCYNCKFKNIELSYADFIIGDHWGSENQMHYNKYGNSLILPRTPKALALIDSLEEQFFKIVEVDFEEAYKYNHMLSKSITNLEGSNYLKEYFKKNSLKRACELYNIKLKKELEEILSEIKGERYNVALWGVSMGIDNMYEKYDMKNWNIKYIFDSSEYKIGMNCHGLKVNNIKDIHKFNKKIDVIVSLISSTDCVVLKKQLLENGWKGKTFYMGKYRFI